MTRHQILKWRERARFLVIAEASRKKPLGFRMDAAWKEWRRAHAAAELAGIASVFNG